MPVDNDYFVESIFVKLVKIYADIQYTDWVLSNLGDIKPHDIGYRLKQCKMLLFAVWEHGDLDLVIGFDAVMLCSHGSNFS